MEHSVVALDFFNIEGDFSDIIQNIPRRIGDNPFLPVDYLLPYPKYFISDMHLGVRDSADDFLSNENKFKWFLDNVVIDPSQLYILGDYMDIWEVGSMSPIVRSYPSLYSTLNNSPKVYGNHDANQTEYTDESIALGNHILMQHGHQVDILNSKLSWVGYALTKIRWCFELLGVNSAWLARKIASTVSEAPLDISDEYFEEIEKAYYAYADMLSKKYGYQLFIFGHTHNPRIYSRDRGSPLVVNCGDWVKNCSYVRVDILPTNLRISLNKVL